MDVVDIWVNLVTEQTAAAFLGQDENAHIPGYLGSNEGPLGVDGLQVRVGLAGAGRLDVDVVDDFQRRVRSFDQGGAHAGETRFAAWTSSTSG